MKSRRSRNLTNLSTDRRRSPLRPRHTERIADDKSRHCTQPSIFSTSTTFHRHPLAHLSRITTTMAFPVSAPGVSETAAAPSAPSAFAPYLDAVSHVLHPVAAPIAHTVNRFHGWKESWGLVQPGTVENVTKEVSSGSPFHVPSALQAGAAVTACQIA